MWSPNRWWWFGDGAGLDVGFSLGAGDEEVNPARALFHPVLIKLVRVNCLTSAVFRFSIVPRCGLVCPDDLQHFCVFGAALAAKGMRALCDFRDTKLYDHVIAALLPPDQIAIRKDAGLSNCQIGSLGINQVGAVEVGAVEVGVAEVGAAEVGAVEVGAAEVGAAEVGAAEVGAAEVGAVEVGAAEVGAVEVGAVEVGAVEVGAVEVGAVEVGT